MAMPHRYAVPRGADRVVLLLWRVDPHALSV